MYARSHFAHHSLALPTPWAALALGALVSACARPVPRPITIARPTTDATTSSARGDGGTATGRPRLPPVVVGDFAPHVDRMETWVALASQPLRELNAHTETVKVIIDLEDHDRVYFLQTRQWEIHYYFIQRFLARPGHPIPEAEAFWQREYLSQNRRFVEGTVIHYRDSDLWTFELIAQDVLDLPRTLAAFRNIRDHMWNGDRLRYHPVPAHHVAAIDQIRAQIPVVTTDDIFTNTRYQPLNPGEAYGYLRFFDGPVDPARVRPYDIVVLAQVPLDLPVCAGVITAELQTPLSHIAVLSANRRTPNMALRNANREPSLRAFEGQLVRLHVTPQDYEVTRAVQADAERAWNARRPPNDFHPRRSDRDTGLPDLAHMHLTDLDTVGAKASQLGELAQIRPAIHLPRAFAIPFHAYAQHLRRAGLDTVLHRMLADHAFQSDPAVRQTQLRTFRQRVEAAPLDPGLIARVHARIQQLFPGVGVRFRSSTNAEDLPGFNGAGLYTSDHTGANPTDEQISHAIRAVYASTWNFQGYEERSYYRIVHEEVAMAVLVQESIDSDQAIGVAITGNPFDEGRPGIFINTQVSAGSVTSAATGEVPEQVLFYTYPPPGAIERISSSSRTAGRPVLQDAEVIRLAGVLRQIHLHFYGDLWQTGQAMDVEFLVAGADRHVVVVQARPYRMVFDEGRGWARPPS